MDFFLQVLIIFITGVVASFVGASIGSGGIISISVLLFMGLPPQIAISINKFGAVGMGIGAAIGYYKEKKIIWSEVLPFSVLSIMGGIIGSLILVSLSTNLVSKILTIFLILLIPFLFISKNLGTQSQQVSKNKKILGYILYLLLTILGGFFGAGAGILFVILLMYFFGFRIIDSFATEAIPWLLLSISSLLVLIINGFVDYYLGITIFTSMILGGYLGSKFAVKIGDKYVKGLFILTILAVVIKLLFF